MLLDKKDGNWELVSRVSLETCVADERDVFICLLVWGVVWVSDTKIALSCSQIDHMNMR